MASRSQAEAAVVQHLRTKLGSHSMQVSVLGCAMSGCRAEWALVKGAEGGAKKGALGRLLARHPHVFELLDSGKSVRVVPTAVTAAPVGLPISSAAAPSASATRSSVPSATEGRSSAAAAVEAEARVVARVRAMLSERAKAGKEPMRRSGVAGLFTQCMEDWSVVRPLLGDKPSATFFARHTDVFSVDSGTADGLVRLVKGQPEDEGDPPTAARNASPSSGDAAVPGAAREAEPPARARGISAHSSLRDVPWPVTVVADESAGEEAASVLSRARMLAVDCEGVDLGQPHGELCLVQVAVPTEDVASAPAGGDMVNSGPSMRKAGGGGTQEGNAASSAVTVYLLDVQQCPPLLHILRAVLGAEDAVTFLHDARADAAALMRAGGIELGVCVDTQLLHCALGGGVQESLARMLAHYGTPHPCKKDAPHRMRRRAWAERPLSAQALAYAAADVALLLPSAMRMLHRVGPGAALARVLADSRARVGAAVRAVEREHTAADESGDGLFSSDTGVAYALAWARSHADRHVPFAVSVDSELDAFEAVLPPRVCAALRAAVPDYADVLVDVVMDAERPLQFILHGRPPVRVPECVVTMGDLGAVVAACGAVSDGKRACVGRSLHRCSVGCDPATGQVVMLTLRLARVVRGLADTIDDVLAEGLSVLLVGPPGSGKSTLLRDIAQALASERHDRRVMVVDTSNEIGGEGTLPHPAIGHARRLKVGARSRQPQVMLEAIQNHTPEVLVIDEIGTRSEASEAIAIRQRGVQLVATTHGESIADVIRNPTVRPLLGDTHAVILSASERASERTAAKTRLERKTPPAFDVCVELLASGEWRLHRDVAAAVDAVLRGLGETVPCELRRFDGDSVHVRAGVFPEERDAPDALAAMLAHSNGE